MNRIFIDRRKGDDRRLEQDRCKDLPLDLFHRKRRKSADRRATGRSLSEDYFAFMDTGTRPHEPCQNDAGFTGRLADVTEQDSDTRLN